MAFEVLKGKMDGAVFMLCTLIVFLFVTTSCPVAQFRGRGMNVYAAEEHTRTPAAKHSCITVWGYKDNCIKNTYAQTVGDISNGEVKRLFQVSEAMYIIGIFVSLLLIALTGLYLNGMKLKLVLIILGAVEIGLTLIPWACMTAVWSKDFGTTYDNLNEITANAYTGDAYMAYGEALRYLFKFSAGYGLTIAAFIVQLFGFGCLLVL